MINSFLVFIPLVVLFGAFAGFAYTYEFKPKYDTKVLEEEYERLIDIEEKNKTLLNERAYLVGFTNYMQGENICPGTSKKYFEKNPLPQSLKGN